MPLREYMDAFAADVVRVDEAVSTDCGMTPHILKNPEKAHHFTRVEGCGWETVWNLWGTRARVGSALGIAPGAIVPHLLKAWRDPAAPEVVTKARFQAHTLERGGFDLRKLPIARSYPGERGRYLSSGIVVAELRDSSGTLLKRNLSYHRMFIAGPDRVVARVVPRHLNEMRKRAGGDGVALGLAVIIGTDPAAALCGGLSAEYEMDELSVASALHRSGRGRALPVARLGNGVEVPADTEVVMEARFTGETGTEGPYVDITGTYDAEWKDQPVIEFTRLHHAERPVLHNILGASMEHRLLMGLAREPVILEGVGRAVPVVTGVRLTEGGCGWLHGVVAIEKKAEGDGKNAVMAALASHPSMKRVIVVDHDIDIYDDREVEWALATRFQTEHTVHISHARGSTLDKSAEKGLTSKIGLDATVPQGQLERFRRASLKDAPYGKQ